MIKKFYFIIFLFSIFYTIKSFAKALDSNYGGTDTLRYSGKNIMCLNGSKVLEFPFLNSGDTIEWFYNGILQSGNQPTFTAQNAGTYNAKITLAGGQGSKISNTLSLTKVDLPIADYSFSPNNNCPEIPVDFVDKSTGAVGWLWDFGDINSPNNSSTKQSPSHVFFGTPGDGTQNFTVKLTVTNANGCIATISYPVTTKQSPDATLFGNNSKIIDGKTYFTQASSVPIEFTFKNTSSTKLTNTKYEIDWGDGATINNINVNDFSILKHTYGLGLNQLVYSVTGINGCVKTITYAVYVGGNPSVGFGNPGNTIICVGNSLTFPITGDDKNPDGTIYTITFNDGSTPDTLKHPLTTSSITHQFLKSSCGITSSSGNLLYPNSFSGSIVATNPYSSSSAIAQSIYVSDVPKALFNMSTGSSVCVNSNTTFSNVSLGNIVNSDGCIAGNSVWDITPKIGWTLVSGDSKDLGNDYGLVDPKFWDSGKSDLQIKFTSQGNYTIKLKTGTSKDLTNGCGQDFIIKNICVNLPPTADFILDKIKSCDSLQVNVSNKSNIPYCGANSYQWKVAYSNPQSCTGAIDSFRCINNTSLTSQNPQFMFTGAGLYSLSLTTTNADGTDCAVTSASQIITIKSKPVVSAILPDFACAGADIKFSSTVKNCYADSVETYKWTFTGANITISTDKTPINITYATAGTYLIKLEVTNECGTTTLNSSIKINTTPEMQTMGNEILCPGVASENINFLIKNSVNNVSYSWTRTSQAIGTLDFAGVGNYIPSFTPINNGATVLTSTFTVTPTLNGCSGFPITFKISVNPLSPKANAGSTQRLCNQIETNLSGNDPGAFVGTWTTKATGVIFENINKYNTKVSGLTTSQDYTFRWTIAGANPCSADSSDVIIYNRPLVTLANAGVDATVCDYSANPLMNNSYVLQGNSDLTRSSYETGTWSVLSKPLGNSPFFDGPTIKNTTFGNLVPGTYQLAWTITNDANCSSSIDTVVVKVYSKPTAGVTTPLSPICSGESVTLTNTGAIGEILLWQYSPNINGTWTDIPNSKKTSVTDFNVTSTRYYRFQIASESSDCKNTVFYVVDSVQVYPTSVGGTAGDAQTLCSKINSGNVSLANNVGSVVRWEQSLDNVNFTAITNSASVNYVFTNITATTYFRAVVKSGTCTEATSASVKITLGETVETANAGTNQILCNLTGNITLAANVPTKGATKWTQISGPPINFDDATLANTQVNITQNGTYVFDWTISNDVCPSSISSVTVYNYPTIVNQILNTATYCYGQQAVITGQIPTGGDGTYTYSWQKSSNNTDWETIVNEVSKDLNFTDLNTVYVRRLVTSAICESMSLSSKITFLPAISGNSIITPNQDICITAPIKLIGTTPTGGNGYFTFLWESSADNVNWSVITNASVKDYQPVNLLVDTYFKRMVTSGECTGAQKSESNVVKITVRLNAFADFAAATTNPCTPFDLKEVITVTPHPDRNSSYQWFANGESIGFGADFPSGYTIKNDGEKITIKLIATSKYGCLNDSNEVTFNTTEKVKVSFTKDAAKVCGPVIVNFTNTSSPINGATYLWDFGNGVTSNQANPVAPVYNPHPLGKDTTYYISLTATTKCLTTTITDSVTVRAKPQAVFSPDVTNGCSPLTINFTNQSRGIPNTYTFNFGDGTTLTKSDNAIVTHIFTAIKTDTVTVKLFAKNECGIDSTSYQIVIYPNTIKPALVVNGNKLFGCAPFEVEFYNNSEGASSFKWDFADGGTATSSVSPSTMSHVFKTSGSYTVKLTGSNVCTAASTTKTIVVYEQPSASYKINKTQYCIGEDVLFTNTSLPNYTFLWDFSDGVTTNEVNPIHKFSQAGDIIVKLTASQTFVDGTTCSYITTKILSIIPKPIANFTTNANVLNCAPFTIVANATPLNASGGVEWNFGDTNSVNNISQGSKASHVFNTPGIYVVKSFAYNQTGCADSAQQIIRITESPKAEFDTAETLICGSSKTITFNNKTTYGGTGNLGYNWLVNDSLVSNQKNLIYNFNPASNVVLPYIYKVKLIVLSTIGCPDTVMHQIQFNILPKANFTIANNIACAPFTPIIKNTSSYADQYKWYLDNVLVSTDVDLKNLLITQPNKTFKLKLVAGNLYGCRLDSLEQQITAYPQPKSIFTVLNSISCNGKLDLGVVNKSVGATRYKWNFGDATLESNLANPTHIYGTAGVYKLTLIVYNDLCGDTSSVNIKISNAPKAAFKADKTKGCTKLDVSFEDLSDNVISYLWNFGDGSFSTSKNPVHSYTYQNSPFNVKLIVVGQYGCSDSTIKANFINVDRPPKAEFDTAETLICGNSKTITFNNKTTYGGTGNLGYNWLVNDSLVSNQKNLTYNFNPASNLVLPYIYKVKLIVLSTIGCPDTVMHQIQFNPLPKANFTIANNIACVPFTPIIKNTSSYADQYKWYLDNVLVSTDVDLKNLLITQPNKTFKLKLVAGNLYGCRLDSLEQQITAYPQPKSIFTVLNSISCNGKLDLGVVNKSVGATRYKWNFGDATLESNLANPTHIYGTAGVYKLTLIVYNDLCGDTSSVNIKISNAPKAAFKADKTKGCTKLDVSFEDLSDNVISYLWNFGDGSFSTSKNPVHSYTYQNSPFNVKLIVVGQYGCSDTTIKTNFINVARPPKAEFDIFPKSIINIPDYTFNFENKSEGNPINFLWNFGNGKTSTLENPSYIYPDTGSYKIKLIVTNAEGCTDTVTKIAKINGVPGYLFIPNAFEPGSQKADLRTFGVKGSGIAIYDIKIFSKWGEQIWESDKLSKDGVPSESWDGTMKGLPAPQGVYIWSAYAKFINGNEWNGMKYQKGTKRTTGAIHLIR